MCSSDGILHKRKTNNKRFIEVKPTHMQGPCHYNHGRTHQQEELHNPKQEHKHNHM
jgi:hypothetical protein